MDFDLSQVAFHSFHWRNFNRDILAAHRRVMDHFGLNVHYTEEDIPHGQWLDRIVGNAQAKVVAIIEPDLIPLNRRIVEEAARYALEHDSFIGCAQASNHIPPCSHIFASPAFFFITPSCYRRLGQPSFLEVPGRADVAQMLSYRAEEIGIRYRTLYPTCFEREPAEGIWPLGSYGHYGIGTVFADSVYHLFQSRYAAHADLFVRRCAEVVAGRFDSSGFIRSTGFDPGGRVVEPPLILPAPLQAVQAVYPPAAQAAGETGDTVLALDIDEYGRLNAVHIEQSSGYARLDEAAAAAVAATPFAPARQGGRPLPCRLLFRIGFHPH